MTYKMNDLLIGALGISLISNAVLSGKLKKAERKNEIHEDCLEIMNRTMLNMMNENEKLRVEVKAAKKK